MFWGLQEKVYEPNILHGSPEQVVTGCSKNFFFLKQLWRYIAALIKLQKQDYQRNDHFCWNQI